MSKASCFLLQVLADFVKVITPSAAPANGPVNWLRQLGASQALKLTTPANCSSIKASGADKCTRPEPARICPNAYRYAAHAHAWGVQGRAIL